MEEYQRMKKPIIPLISLLLLIILAGTLLASCGSGSPSATSPSGSSSSNGQALMQDRCSVCHSLDRVTSAHHTADEWKVTVDRMINRGAQLTPQEEQTLIDYLAQNYK
jgi:mono/diheme cytochrome c family protein